MARKFHDYGNFIHYDSLSVTELRKIVEKKLSKNADYEPVIVKSNAHKGICQSWWGEAWCRNLERYADLENRIGRGKSYVRNGAIIDLKINSGEIYAKVQGSRRTPYKVKITLDKINDDVRHKIEQQATGKIQNLESLMTGSFPDDLKELFFSKAGLFPTPDEIHFNCSCPDWARMCKHVAAVLFGIWVRLDDNPLYFFKMRGIDIDDFVSKVVSDKIENMLQKINVSTARIIQNSDLTQLFGI